MSVTLTHILTLVGWLDDDPGVESPSQRFRQFLTERVTDVRVARSLIKQCQGAHGEIERRALQDLIVCLGRFLGFEVVFGCYEPLAGILEYHGHWRSPHNREVLIEVRTDRTNAADLKSLSRSVTALAATSSRSADAVEGLARDSQPIGLSVTTRLYARRDKLEHAFHNRKTGEKLRLASSASLVRLAELVSGGRVTHTDILGLFDSAIVLDPIVALLGRPSTMRGPATPVAMSRSESHAVGDGLQTVPRPRFWLATILADGETPPERVAAFIGTRRTFHLSGDAAPSRVQPLDWVCFCLPGTGVVGHAQVASVNEALLHLQNVRVYPETPAVPGLQTQLRVTAAYTAVEPGVHGCLPLSEDEFNELTRSIGRQPWAAPSLEDGRIAVGENEALDETPGVDHAR